MQDFQQRVVTEKAELDDKISRLLPFVGTERFAALPLAERCRMMKQLHLMQDYSAVLAERITVFTP